MTDHLMKLRARKAAKDYISGDKLRRDSIELSDKCLQDKFGCSEWTINRVKSRLPNSVLNDEEQEWLRGCIAEKARIDRQLMTLTKEYLCNHYQVSREAMDIELELAGYETPKIRRKKKVAAA